MLSPRVRCVSAEVVSLSASSVTVTGSGETSVILTLSSAPSEDVVLYFETDGVDFYPDYDSYSSEPLSSYYWRYYYWLTIPANTTTAVVTITGDDPSFESTGVVRFTQIESADPFFDEARFSSSELFVTVLPATGRCTSRDAVFVYMCLVLRVFVRTRCPLVPGFVNPFVISILPTAAALESSSLDLTVPADGATFWLGLNMLPAADVSVPVSPPAGMSLTVNGQAVGSAIVIPAGQWEVEVFVKGEHRNCDSQCVSL